MMNYEKTILSRLLDKYEHSKHLFEPGSSNRRVMIYADKQKHQFPEYDYENSEVRNAFNTAAKRLEIGGIVKLEWRPGRQALSAVILNLDTISEAYRLAERLHPKEIADNTANMIEAALEDVKIEWISSWGYDVISKARETYRVPTYCKDDALFLKGLLTALVSYDKLQGESITMRAFSARCYQDTKRFEREFRDEFLHIAEKYNGELAEICVQYDMGTRDKLAFLGIYARPELYELSGNCVIKTERGCTDLSSLYPHGIAISGALVDLIKGFDMSSIRKVTFIENKTNYDEYLLSEIQSDELVVYHGGFLSPQKRKLFKNLSSSLSDNVIIRFWADIDLGGFQMFLRLQEIIPWIEPMRMTGELVRQYNQQGLARSESYLNNLKICLADEKYYTFRDAIKAIIDSGVTIEQEVFLDCPK